MSATDRFVVGPNLEGLTDELQLWEWGDRLGHVRALDDERFVAVVPFLFTWGLIVGRKRRPFFYDDRWCYHHHPTALVAAARWDGAGEPQGWHRHVNSGRRRDEHGNEHVWL